MERIKNLAIMAGLAAATQLALTKRERDSILERDDNRCQFPLKHVCRGDLQVHHVIPQRYAERLGIPSSMYDQPENLITLCFNVHVGDDPNCIHPDIRAARSDYRRGDKNAFAEAFHVREELIRARQPYWNTANDRLLTTKAWIQTAKAIRNGWRYLTSKDKYE